VLDDAAVDVHAHRLGGGRLQGVPGVEADPTGAAVDGLGHVLGPLVIELLGVDLDQGRVLGKDRRAERPGGLGGLPGQDLVTTGAGAVPLPSQLVI
jgi:hypothetical protein